jgi:hypothetical protein
MEPWFAKIIKNLEKIILVAWVDNALNQSLTKLFISNFDLGFVEYIL